MSQNVAFTITQTGILLMLDANQYQVPQNHPNFAKIKQALVEKRYNEVPSLMDTRKAVTDWLSSNRRFLLEDDLLTLDGRVFSDEITDKVLSMIDEGWTPEPLFNFLLKVRKNPSAAAQNELLLFCVANDFMIHIDGDIMAYKSVREDFKDIHSGRISNRVGAIVQMERNAVDDNRDKTCSYGLHFASHEYASTWSDAMGHLMLLKINPADVVSIPSDYDNQKGRTCRYEVVAEVPDAGRLPKKEVYQDRDWDFDNQLESGDADCCGDYEEACDIDPFDGWCHTCHGYCDRG